MGSLGGEKHNGAAAQFASGDFQAGVVNDQLGEGQLGGGGFAKGEQHLLGEAADQLGGKAGGQGAGEHGAFAVHGEAAGRQVEQRGGGFGEEIQEAHSAKTF